MSKTYATLQSGQDHQDEEGQQVREQCRRAGRENIVRPNAEVWGKGFACGVLCGLACYIQGVAGYYLVPAISENELQEKVNITFNQFHVYREKHASDIELICNKSQWSWPESVTDNLLKYDEKATLFLFIPMSKGQLFGLICMGVWSLMIAMQCRAIMESCAQLFMTNATAMDDADQKAETNEAEIVKAGKLALDELDDTDDCLWWSSQTLTNRNRVAKWFWLKGDSESGEIEIAKYLAESESDSTKYMECGYPLRLTWSTQFEEDIYGVFAFVCTPKGLNEYNNLELDWEHWKGHAAVCVITCFRLWSLGLVAHYGMMFLAYTDNLNDFILNALALAFVFEIPEIVHKAFTPRDVQLQIRKFNDDHSEVRFAIPKHVSSFRLFVLCVGNAVGFVYGVWCNMQFAYMVNASVVGQLCPNKTDVVNHWLH